MKLLPLVCAMLLGFVLAGSALAVDSGRHYHLLTKIPIGGEGGWDCLTVDSPAHRLYVTHGTKIVVLDTITHAIIGEIQGLEGVHDFVIAPGTGRGFASNGRNNTVSIIDLSTLKVASKVETGENPDIMLIEPAREEVYAFNGRGRSATVISAKAGQVVATIPLNGRPEFACADNGKVFVNLNDMDVVAVIDVATHQVINRWPIGDGQEPTGMAIDSAHHRIFVACENALLIVMDSQDGHIVASLPAGKGIDGAEFDPETQFILVPLGADAKMMVVHEDSPNQFRLVQKISTEPVARTIALDPATHRAYTATASFEPLKSGQAKPRMIPGTLRLLVLELSE